MDQSAVSRDLNHRSSRSWAMAWSAGGGIIAAPVLLLVEVAGAVTRRTGDADQGERAAIDLASDSGVVLIDIDSRLAIESASLASSLRLRGADAIYVAVAKRLGVPLITWDAEQRERAASEISVFTPATAPGKTTA
ncbi:MAG: type II toxin-antitoxin system VapC family toxin [Thermomicrobiales bacterium]